MAITDNYTNDQLNTIKEASFKVSDAYYMLKELAETMAANKEWRGQADIARIVSDLGQLTEKEGGSLNAFLKAL